MGIGVVKKSTIALGATLGCLLVTTPAYARCKPLPKYDAASIETAIRENEYSFVLGVVHEEEDARRLEVVWSSPGSSEVASVPLPARDEGTVGERILSEANDWKKGTDGELVAMVLKKDLAVSRCGMEWIARSDLPALLKRMLRTE